MAIGTGTALLGGALIGGAASMLGSKQQASASQSAAQTQADAATQAANRAANVQMQMYRQSRQDMAPWRRQGENALQELQQMLRHGPGRFKASEGYQWTLDQGLQAGQRAASAGGQLRSGNAVRAATDYAEGLASTEYDNFLNRWYKSLTPYQSLAGVGQTAASQQAGNAMGAGNALAGIYQNQGNIAGQALAAGQLGAGQAQAAGMMGLGNTASNFGNWYAQNQYQQQLMNAIRPQGGNSLSTWNPGTTGNFYNW